MRCRAFLQNKSMNKYFYDLHVHSCLSPCADSDNTPCNLAGMAAVSGLNIMALTDHNTAKNCPAFFAAAKQYGIIPVAGMELTTAEEIHVVCLFEELEEALSFSDEIDSRRIKIPNRPDIFGEQPIMGEEDEIIGFEPHLLSNATTVSLDEVPKLVEKYNGVCYPAHIDREANGIIAILGSMPESPKFNCVEFKDPQKVIEYREKYSLSHRIIIDSDAHYLGDISDADNYFVLDDEPYSSKKVRQELFKLLRSKE